MNNVGRKPKTQNVMTKQPMLQNIKVRKDYLLECYNPKSFEIRSDKLAITNPANT